MELSVKIEKLNRPRLDYYLYVNMNYYTFLYHTWYANREEMVPPRLVLHASKTCEIFLNTFNRK